jgi:DNA-binding MurR/RpiR family transcriptional regulator
MQGFNRLKEAIERHKENKDPNLKYKTPLTSKRPPQNTKTSPCLNVSAVRNIQTKDDEQRIDDACNPLQRSRSVRVSEWLQLVQGVSTVPYHLNISALSLSQE